MKIIRLLNRLYSRKNNNGKLIFRNNNSNNEIIHSNNIKFAKKLRKFKN